MLFFMNVSGNISLHISLVIREVRYARTILAPYYGYLPLKVPVLEVRDIGRGYSIRNLDYRAFPHISSRHFHHIKILVEVLLVHVLIGYLRLHDLAVDQVVRDDLKVGQLVTILMICRVQRDHEIDIGISLALKDFETGNALEHQEKTLGLIILQFRLRSEERRVGKECSDR